MPQGLHFAVHGLVAVVPVVQQVQLLLVEQLLVLNQLVVRVLAELQQMVQVIWQQLVKAVWQQLVQRAAVRGGEVVAHVGEGVQVHGVRAVVALRVSVHAVELHDAVVHGAVLQQPQLHALAGHLAVQHGEVQQLALLPLDAAAAPRQ